MCLQTRNAFQIESFGDHLQTFQAKSAATQVHDWVVYRLGDILGSVGHRVKIHKITPVTGKERGDIEIKDYVLVLQSGLAKTPGTDGLPSSSAYPHIRFHIDSHAFRKITVAFSRTADAHEAFGWCT